MVYLIIRKSDHTVFGAQRERPPEGAFSEELFEIKEWSGPIPQSHDPEQGITSYDPTLDDPDYPVFLEARVDFEALADLAAGEVEWLEETIPTIADPTMRRIAQENLRMIKAWQYVLRRLA